MRNGLYLILLLGGLSVHALDLPFDLSAAAPYSQLIAKSQADQTYAQVETAVAAQPRNEIDLINAAELKRQISLFELRGYMVDPERTTLTLFKSSDRFELYYTLVLMKPDEPPSATVLVPRLRMNASVFTRCEARCEVASVYFQSVEVFWGNLPWDKGGNTSAGGTVRPP